MRAGAYISLRCFLMPAMLRPLVCKVGRLHSKVPLYRGSIRERRPVTRHCAKRPASSKACQRLWVKHNADPGVRGLL